MQFRMLVSLLALVTATLGDEATEQNPPSNKNTDTGGTKGTASTADAEAEPQSEPGPLEPNMIRVAKLAPTPGEGNAAMALKTFVTAHQTHKAGQELAALRAYLRYQGMPGRAELPARYDRTVQTRVKRLAAAITKRYEAACETYRKDRRRGIAALRAFAKTHQGLPHGVAARAFAQTDELHRALETARMLRDRGKAQEGARILERAVRTLPFGEFRYEAKTLLVELGGPDLFEKGERITDPDGDATAPDSATPPSESEDSEEEETTIEVGGEDKPK